LKTKIYVDGYNFYYGLLNSTQYKWLNLESLLTSIVNQIERDSVVDSLYYFTSGVKANISIHGKDSITSQNAYHGALRSISQNIQIIKGYHIIDEKTVPSRALGQSKPDRSVVCDIWHIEEKQTDVNIGIQIIKDILTEDVEQIVLVSNDTDLAPALEMSRELRPDMKIGVIFPINDRGQKGSRKPNRELSDNADWTRTKINEIELSDHQLPQTIPKKNGRGICRKPEYW